MFSVCPEWPDFGTCIEDLFETKEPGLSQAGFLKVAWGRALYPFLEGKSCRAGIILSGP